MAEAPRGRARRSSISWKRCARASRRSPRKQGRRPPSPQAAQGREEGGRRSSERACSLRRARGREAPAPAAQHDPRADRGRLRLARARPAQRVAVLVPGPDRAAHRAGAGRGQRAGAAHHALAARAAPPPARRDAALGPAHRRGRRPRRRARRARAAGRRSPASTCSRSRAIRVAATLKVIEPEATRAAWKTLSIEAICCTRRGG